MTYNVTSQPVRVFDEDVIETNIGEYEYSEKNRVNRHYFSNNIIVDEYNNGDYVTITLKYITIENPINTVLYRWETRSNEKAILRSIINDVFCTNTY